MPEFEAYAGAMVSVEYFEMSEVAPGMSKKALADPVTTEFALCGSVLGYAVVAVPFAVRCDAGGPESSVEVPDVDSIGNTAEGSGSP